VNDAASTAQPPFARVLGLTTVGGTLYFLGWAGFGIWPLALVCLVPLWAALELEIGTSWQRSLAVGWVYGTVAYLGGYHWLVEFLDVFSGYGIAASSLFFLLFCAYLGFDYALYALAYRALRRRGWTTPSIAIPILVLMEWAYPALFPTYIANSFHTLILTTQIAELGGPLLVSSLIVLVNLAVYEGGRWALGHRKAPRVLFAVTAAASIASVTYGVVRVEQVEAAMSESPVFRVGVVQVNMGIFEKRSEALEGHRRHLEQSETLEAEGELDLIVWPESAFVSRLSRKLPWNGDFIRGSIETPLLFGGVSVGSVDGERKVYNSVFLMDGEGVVRGTYDKTYLLMFGEYLPFGNAFPVLYELSPNSGRFTAGSHVQPVELGDWRIATPVCYEDILAPFTRKMVREGNPHVLINLTNDAWFGDTQEPFIHLVLSKYRAIEHRRYLVRSTNSGISAIIDPLGRVVARSGLLTRENLRADIRMMNEDTIYTRFGDWPGWLSLLVLAWMWLNRRSAAR
jgi:apolipoprotein N-acyltransferase